MHKLNKILFLTLTGIFSSLICSAQDTIFDDFNDPVVSDSLWDLADRPWAAGSPANPSHGGVVPELISFSDGLLIIKGHGNLYDGDIMGHGRKTKVGACIISKQKYASGSYEVKAKILPRLGALSAFWTFDFEPYANADSGNINHEIDIEIKQDQGAFNQALCNTWTYEKVRTLRTNNDFLNQDDGNFHIYRFDWHTGGDGIEPWVDFYYDGELKETINTTVPMNHSKFWVGVWFPAWVGEPDFAIDSMVVDWVKITPFHEPNDSLGADPEIERKPFGNEPIKIPGKIEAEDFDIGSNGDSYYDLDAGNTGNAYRLDTDVDIEAWPNEKYAVGYVEDNEWLEYTVNVTQADNYVVSFAVASGLEGGEFHLELDGIDITGLISTPGTNGWGNFEIISLPNILFSKGESILRVFFDKGDFNLDYIAVLDTIAVALPQGRKQIFTTMEIYPNPCDHFFNISVSYNPDKSSAGTLQLFNLLGEKILEQQLFLNGKSETKVFFDKNVRTGNYIVQLITEDITLHKKLIIE